MLLRPSFAAMVLVFAILPSAADSGVVKTSDESEPGGIRITSPADGDSLPAGKPVVVTYEATLGFKGRYVQLQLDDRTPLVMDDEKGSNSFSDVGEGKHRIRASLLNPAHAELGIDDSITVKVEGP